MSAVAAPANIINHIVLVLDASTSMEGRNAQSLIKVADNQIAHLAERSKDLDQETRITVYTFGGYPHPKIDCLVWDKDVLRMPSIAGLYSPYGNTPLIDGTLKAIEDLTLTPEIYGEHSFLVYVLTDGIENVSRNSSYTLRTRIDRLPEHWTVATFVPDEYGRSRAQQNGFPAANIAVWDVNDHQGLEKAGEVMRDATESFMQARRAGVRGTKQLFSITTPSLAEVKVNLIPIKGKDFDLYNVGPEKCRIDEFVAESSGEPYRKGSAFYQLTKRETIQASKQIAIRGAKGVYTGAAARQLLGLPDYEVKVDPAHHKDYDVFVQSTSVNRNLMPNTQVLVLR